MNVKLISHHMLASLYVKQMNVVSLCLVLVFISRTYNVYMKISINKCILLLIFHYELVALVQLWVTVISEASICIADSTRMQFFRSVAQALLDFNELNPIAPLQLLLEALNSKKSLPGEMLSLVLPNMACYLDCLPLEAGLGPASTTWSALLTQLEILFRHLVLLLSTLDDVEPLLRIMVSVLKVPGIFAYKVSFQ